METLDSIAKYLITSKARPGAITHHIVVRFDGNENKCPIAELVGQPFIFVLASHVDGWTEACNDTDGRKC